jgi:hypothetical protein
MKMPRIIQKFKGSVITYDNKSFLAIIEDRTDPKRSEEEAVIQRNAITPQQELLLKHKGLFDWFIYSDGKNKFHFYKPKYWTKKELDQIKKNATKMCKELWSK